MKYVYIPRFVAQLKIYNTIYIEVYDDRSVFRTWFHCVKCQSYIMKYLSFWKKWNLLFNIRESSEKKSQEF